MLMHDVQPTTSVVTTLIIDEYELCQLKKKTRNEVLSTETQKKKGKKKDVECFGRSSVNHCRSIVGSNADLV
jgi:hypothetical protein